MGSDLGSFHGHGQEITLAQVRRERDLLLDALDAVISANDSLSGALCTIHAHSGDEAYDLAKRLLYAKESGKGNA